MANQAFISNWGGGGEKKFHNEKVGKLIGGKFHFYFCLYLGVKNL